MTPGFVPFEHRNIEAYRLLLRVEVVLRELLRESLHKQFGTPWRKRLPGALLGKIRAGERDEELKKQLGFVRLGPLYYLTLGELTELLLQAPAAAAVKRLGSEGFTNQLQNVLPIRNAVGHCREVSPTSFSCVDALYKQMVTALGLSEVERLASQPDTGLRAEEAIPPILEC